jgi:hypothetical protein
MDTVAALEQTQNRMLHGALAVQLQHVANATSRTPTALGGERAVGTVRPVVRAQYWRITILTGRDVPSIWPRMKLCVLTNFGVLTNSVTRRRRTGAARARVRA